MLEAHQGRMNRTLKQWTKCTQNIKMDLKNVVLSETGISEKGEKHTDQTHPGGWTWKDKWTLDEEDIPGWENSMNQAGGKKNLNDMEQRFLTKSLTVCDVLGWLETKPCGQKTKNRRSVQASWPFCKGPSSALHWGKLPHHPAWAAPSVGSEQRNCSFCPMYDELWAYDNMIRN